MITLILTVFSALLPFLPGVLDLLRGRMDNQHELEMMRMRMQFAAQDAMWRMEEVSARADIEEAKAVHRPMQSFGVQLLDAAKGMLPGWLLAPVFFLFGAVDFLNATVRPVITYLIVGGYVAYKWARFDLMKSVSSPDLNWQTAVIQLWTEDDFTVLMMVLGFWFGARLVKKRHRPNG